MPAHTNTMFAIPLGVLVGTIDESYCLKSASNVLTCFSANQEAKCCYSTTHASDFYLMGEGDPLFESWCFKNF